MRLLDLKDLYTVRIDASDVKRLGLEIASSYNSTLRKRVERIAIMALAAFKTTVPIDTGSLRNQKLNYALYSRQGNYEEGDRDVEGLIEARVYVEPSAHIGRRSYMGSGGYVMSSSEIAEILNKGKNDRGGTLRRSRESEPERPFNFSKGARTETAGWIDEGRTLIEREYSRYLNG